MKVIVDEERCTGCGACVEVCPVSAVDIKNGKAAVSDECVECGACIGACPVEAITLPK